MEPQMIDYYNEEPQIMKIIEKDKYYIQKGYDIYELHIVHFIGVEKINGKLNIILKSV